MGILGTVLFIFLVIHLKGFWYEYKFGSPPLVNYNGVEIRDMYSIVVSSYSQCWYAIFYVVSMLFLSLHLWHGFKSFFQTLGLNHSKYTPLIEKLGIVFSIVIPTLFAIIPICIYFKV
jgi:succinate dehydrogenase / fumarate reductase cytochrome b subunit